MNQEEIIEMIPYVEEALQDDYSFEDLANELYNHESNWNNADKTSGQSVHTEEELLDMIETTWEYMKEKSSEHCSGCGMPYNEDNYITDSQDHPYGDTYATETFAVGHKCSNCGEEERW